MRPNRRCYRKDHGRSVRVAEGLRDYKQAVFEDIKGLIPNLEKAFPDHTIVVRPHRTEDPRIYHEIASKCTRVRVTNEGNVIPWLRAAGALVHNSCTTGVEAYMMGVPAVTYMETRNEYYDDGYYRLPNSVSYRCFNFKTAWRATESSMLSKRSWPVGQSCRRRRFTVK
jgi:surface carbohydrate biosynthesis protein